MQKKEGIYMKGSKLARKIDEEYRRMKYYENKFEKEKCKDRRCKDCSVKEACISYENKKVGE